MTKAAHTPGPWTVGYGKGTGLGTIYAKEQPEKRQSIGDAHLPRLYTEDGKGFSQEAFDICLANASVMAAAPDLLATCEAVLHQLEHGEASDGDERDLAFCAESLREVIAKAKGGVV